MLISINRFERKKNVELALRAFASLKEMVSTEILSNYRLVLAGKFGKDRTCIYSYFVVKSH